MYNFFLKRLLDLIVAVVCFVIFLPVFIVVTILLYFVNQSDPFFLQIRPGKNERLFSIIKFKTMNNKKDKSGVLLPDEQRLTSVGTFIRRASLDEIPQLINVIKGDMSLIGPRPLLPQYLPLYSDAQKRRHNVKPGITGWAQINGRNAISWKKKFEYDIWYVDNVSFLLDLKIIILTIKKVFKSEGISSATSVTMEGFNGEN